MNAEQERRPRYVADAAARAGTAVENRAVAAERRALRQAATAAADTAAFRAGVEQRLRSLENDIAEVKNRINGLLFLVAGAVFTQVALRLFYR